MGDCNSASYFRSPLKRTRANEEYLRSRLTSSHFKDVASSVARAPQDDELECVLGRKRQRLLSESGEKTYTSSEVREIVQRVLDMKAEELRQQFEIRLQQKLAGRFASAHRT